MKISKKIVPLTSFVVVGGGATLVSADELDTSIANARKQGYEVDVTKNTKEVSTRDELNKLLSDEKQRRLQENSKLNIDIKKFEDEKAQALKDYKDEETKINSDYARKLANYKTEFDRVTKERARLTAEYEAKLKANAAILAGDKVRQDKYKEDYAVYEKKLANYNAEVSKIESDYSLAYDNYLKAMSEYNKKVLAGSIKYETEYNKVAEKNATAYAKYLEDKARIEKENAEARANYETEVANIKAENEKAKKEYEEALAKWKVEKVTTENTVKIKDLIDAVLTGKIDELKKQGVNVTVGREEVTEVDGTNGKVSESDANRKLKELTASKIAELERASKTQAANDATNKDYSSKVFSVKAELAKIMGIKVNYTDGGRVTDIASAKSELDQKLAQAKFAGKLAGKLAELNTAIKAHDTGVVENLKAGGIDAAKAQEIYSKKTVVDVGPLTTEYNNLMKKADLSDADINAFVSKVNGELDKAKETINKAINKTNSPSSGTELDDAEYEKKLAEYKTKVREWNAKRNSHYAPTELALDADLNEAHNVGNGGLTNKTTMTFVNSTGGITYYKPKNFSTSDSDVGDYLAQRSHIDSNDFPQVNSLQWGTTGTVDYTRIKFAKGATMTFDYNLKSGKDFFDNSRKENRMVTYKMVDGKPVPTNAKTIRMKFTNNGSQVTRDGSSMYYLFNDLGRALMAAYSTTRDWDNNEGRDVPVDLKHKFLFDFTTEYELLDAQGNPLSVGVKVFDEINENDPPKSEPTWKIAKPYQYPDKVWYLWGKKDKTSPFNHNIDFGEGASHSQPEKPAGWDDMDTSRWVHTYITSDELGKPAKIGTRQQFIEEKSWNYKVEHKDLDEGTYHLFSRIVSGEFTGTSKPVIQGPTFNYTRKSTPVSVLSEIVGNSTIDVPIKQNGSTPVNVTVNPVKVVYKYKETFTKIEPKPKPDKPVPDEATVRYSPLPKESTPESVPGKTPITETPPKEPVKPNKPALPEAPLPPKGPNSIVENPVLDLPELPTKPWEPDKPIDSKFSESMKFSVTVNEYVLKESKVSHAGSLAIKHKLASYANSFTLRKL